MWIRPRLKRIDDCFRKQIQLVLVRVELIEKIFGLIERQHASIQAHRRVSVILDVNELQLKALRIRAPQGMVAADQFAPKFDGLVPREAAVAPKAPTNFTPSSVHPNGKFHSFNLKARAHTGSPP